MRIAPLACLLLLPTALAFAQKTGSGTPVPESPRQGLYRKVSTQLPPGASAEEVRAALLAQHPQVAALGCDLQLRHAISSPGGKHYDFAQTFAGIPIHDTQVKANLGHGMRFYGVLADLKTFSGAPAVHARTDAAVAALLPAMLDEGHADFHVVSNARCYHALDGGLRAAHTVVYTANTMSWEVVLADDDLRELARRDLAAYRRPAKVTTVDTTGNAMVFYPDPLTTSGSTYGGNFVDNGDADNADLNAQRRAVTLKDITWNGSAFVLTGPYVEITDRESPTSAPVTSPDGNFTFTRSQQGFEDVMVYYHLDTFQRYVQRLGFTNLQNGPLKADPHGVNGLDNSHFVPAGVDTRLGFGEGGVDDAEDADVIIHEYGHALSYAGSPGSNSGVERQGLDEGIGDYFAASYSRSLSYNFWKNTFTWDGHNEFWPGRGASVSTPYPPSSTDLYTYGEIWASVLMEVWPQIGQEACDKVVLQSLYGHSSGMLLSDAAMVIFDADSMLYGGMYHHYFQTAFCQRGILDGTMQGQPCFVGVDDGADALGIDWMLYPNPAQGSAHIQLQGQRPASALRYRLVDVMGRELRSGEVHGTEAEIDLQGLAASLYLVELQGSQGGKATKRLRVE